MILHDAVKEVLDRLDLEAQVIAECHLKDALEAHAPLQAEYCPSEQDWADYREWCRQVEANNYQRWLNDPREPE